MFTISKSTYVIVEHFNFTRPTVSILDSITYEECKKYIKNIVRGHIIADRERGWKTKVEVFEDGAHYSITTTPKSGNQMVVDVMMADIVINL